MGRKQIPIDWEIAEKYMIAGCSGAQVAAAFGMHHDTFYQRAQDHYNASFASVLSKFHAHGDAQIYAAQHYKAIGATKKGDNALLTYLGKVRLKQREPSTEVDVGEETIKHFDALMNQISNLQAKDQVVQEAASSE